MHVAKILLCLVAVRLETIKCDETSLLLSWNAINDEYLEEAQLRVSSLIPSGSYKLASIMEFKETRRLSQCQECAMLYFQKMLSFCLYRNISKRWYPRCKLRPQNTLDCLSFSGGPLCSFIYRRKTLFMRSG